MGREHFYGRLSHGKLMDKGAHKEILIREEERHYIETDRLQCIDRLLEMEN